VHHSHCCLWLSSSPTLLSSIRIITLNSSLCHSLRLAHRYRPSSHSSPVSFEIVTSSLDHLSLDHLSLDHLSLDHHPSTSLDPSSLDLPRPFIPRSTPLHRQFSSHPPSPLYLLNASTAPFVFLLRQFITSQYLLYPRHLFNTGLRFFKRWNSRPKLTFEPTTPLARLT
jgi:hypothetical protein